MFPRQGWTIGRVGEIEIKINISLAFIALLVTYTLAVGLLPLAAPGANVWLYWATGLLVSIVFIASILWHELAHSMVAIYYHIPVIQIVLYLFGGVAQIAREPERPVQEFWIAIAGPISSLVLAVIFAMASILGGLPGAAARWLAAVNLTLVLFNLLPGFPLDGGRVLRSILWHFNKSYKQATRQASRVGQGMAALFAIFGLSRIVSGDGFNGIWFILIAAFLYGAATMSFRSAKGAALPMDASIQRVMRYNVPTVEPSMPLAILAWKYLDHAKDQAFPVMDSASGQLVGLISSAEVDRIPRLDWGHYRVEQMMIPRDQLRLINLHDDIQAALKTLEAAGLNHAPVFDAGQFIGMLNRRDIVYRT